MPWSFTIPIWMTYAITLVGGILLGAGCFLVFSLRQYNKQQTGDA